MPNQPEWIVWNGALGIVDSVAIGQTIVGAQTRRAYLAPPYDIVGPFSLDALETQGRIEFGACLVMSRRRWQEDQVALRMAARAKRRAGFAQFSFDDDEPDHREALELSLEGPLQPVQINAAFRRLAKVAHPDAHGSSDHYRRIVQARDRLLALFGNR